MTKRSLFLKVILPVICVLVAAGAALGIYFGVTGGANILAPKKGKMSKADKALAAKYEFYDNGDYYTLSRTKVNNEINVNIPETFKGKPVRVVGERAFADHEEIETLSIGGNVKKIVSEAFRGCSSLISVTIPSSVTSIGDSVFSGCRNLDSITIPNSVESIGGNAFYACSGLTSITIPNSVTSISGYAFYGCSGLQSITVDEGNTTYHSSGNCLIEKESKILVLGCKTSVIPTDGSVTNIGNFAFSGYSVIVELEIPNSVTSIGQSAFSDCSGLTSITIPNSVTSIGDGAFHGCTSLSTLTLEQYPSSMGESAFLSCPIETLTINAGKVGNFLANKSLLTSLTLGEGVTSIGSSAFSGCSGLTSISIPSGVSSIGYEAFYGCNGLTSISIPSSVTSIDGYAFYGCTRLATLTIEKYPTTIGDAAFNNCPIVALTINAGYADISLSNKALLTSLTFGEGVTNIKYGSFRGCSGLESITVAEGNTTYQSSGNCLIETESKTLVLGCKTSVIPTDGSVTDISSYAFSYCSGLTSITIPDSVTRIWREAFSYCSGLTSITIPDSVIFIGEVAFCHCTSLTTLTLEKYSNGMSVNAFYGCPIETLTINAGTVDSFLQNDLRNELLLTSLTLGDSVTSIGPSAFYGCSGLTSVTIPSSVTSIGNYAFSGCRSLATLTLEQYPSSMGESAFLNCPIETLTINGGIIGNELCGEVREKDYNSILKNSLKNLVLGEGVSKINWWAFCHCTKLESVTFPANISYIGAGVFIGCGLESVAVADGVDNKYYSVDNCIIETETNTLVLGCKNSIIPMGVERIGDCAFYGCTGIDALTIPETVKSLGDAAFSDCQINTLICNGTTYETGHDVFNDAQIRNVKLNQATATSYYIDSMTSLSLSENLTTIRSYAFYSCSNLETITFESGIDWDALSIENSNAFGDSSKTHTFNVHVPDEATGDLARTKLNSLDCQKTINIIVD